MADPAVKTLGFFTWAGEPDPFCPHCGSTDLRGQLDYDGARCARCGTVTSNHKLAAAVCAWIREHRG